MDKFPVEGKSDSYASAGEEARIVRNILARAHVRTLFSIHFYIQDGLNDLIPVG